LSPPSSLFPAGCPRVEGEGHLPAAAVKRVEKKIPPSRAAGSEKALKLRPCLAPVVRPTDPSKPSLLTMFFSRSEGTEPFCPPPFFSGPVYGLVTRTASDRTAFRPIRPGWPPSPATIHLPRVTGGFVVDLDLEQNFLEGTAHKHANGPARVSAVARPAPQLCRH